MFREAKYCIEYCERVKGVVIGNANYKDEKKDLAEKIAAHTDAALLGITGHLACFYRRSSIDKKQRITLPQ